MELNELKPVVGSKAKRVGRGHGSGLGKTSGRGQKGQKARTGSHGGPRPGFEGGQVPIYMRFPKRGFSNSPFKRSYAVVNLEQLNGKFEDGEEVTPELLRQRGLVKSNLPVKVLGNGNLSKKLVVKAHRFSRSARERIEALGGSCVYLEQGES